MRGKYFDIERDKQFLYFCHACLQGKSEMSQDSRYCQDCHDFLLKEAELDTSRRSADWMPVKSATKHEIAPIKTARVSQDMRTIMSTLENDKTTVDIIQPSVATKTYGKRGPRFRQLPEDLIWQLAGQDMRSKAIATKLKEQDIEVSYKTIQRILSGERK